MNKMMKHTIISKDWIDKHGVIIIHDCDSLRVHKKAINPHIQIISTDSLERERINSSNKIVSKKDNFVHIGEGFGVEGILGVGEDHLAKAVLTVHEVHII